MRLLTWEQGPAEGRMQPLRDSCDSKRPLEGRKLGIKSYSSKYEVLQIETPFRGQTVDVH